MDGTYNPWLVMLSMAVAVMASYVTLGLASRVTTNEGRIARYWLAGGAVSMGLGIWSMHFIAMLAFQLPMPMSYNAPITALSLLIAMLASGFALYTVSRQALGLRRLMAGGVLMGIGIAAMHYTGMAAMQMSPPVRYEPALFALSIVVAMGASWAALWITFHLRGQTPLSGPWRKAGGALLMAAAICGMHYTGMAAAIYAPHSTVMVGGPVIPSVWLAETIAVFTLMFLATTLVASIVDARQAAEHGGLEQRVGERTAELDHANAMLQAEIVERQATEEALRESKGEARNIIDTAYDAYIGIDANSVILEWNQQAETTFGWVRAEVVDRTMTEIIIPKRYREAHARGIAHFLATGEGPLLRQRIEITALHRDGHEFPIELTIWPTKRGGTYRFSAFLHDIRRQRAIRRLVAQTAAVATLVESATLADAAPKVLEGVCAAMEWRVGALWAVEPTTDTLRCVEFWSAQGGEPVRAFRERTHAMTLAPGVGLPGRVWSSGKPVWVANVALDDNFLRAQSAAEDGMEAGIGFPIISGAKVLGVAEFYAAEISQPDPELLAMMETLGSLLGQFMARKQAEFALEQEGEFRNALLDNITEGIAACDERGILTVFNQATRELHGLPEAPLPPEQWAEHYDMYLPDSITRMQTAQVPLFRAFNGEQVRDVEMVIAPRDRARRRVVCNGRALVNRAGEKLGAVIAMHDITERDAAAQRLQQLAHFDVLTGLPNRRLFQDSLGNAMAMADSQGWRVFVLFLDLDKFKDINDSLGHAVGDELLCQAGQRLLGCVRLRDTVSRLGGDEFGLILMTPSQPQFAAKVADKILEALSAPFDVEGHAASVTASIGITVYPADTTDPHSLMRYADLAMYEAKQGGRNAYRFYTEAMNLRVRERLELESALRGALARNEFELYYQPKVCLRSGRWTGVEALLRWHRPEHGLVLPAQFIGVLEDSGLIVPVGAWVITAACRQLGDWQRAGFGPLPIAVNVAAQQVTRKNLLPPRCRPRTHDDADPVELWSATAACLDKHNVVPDHLEFELTESTVMGDAEHSVEVLSQLKTLGIGISVDDFGTGYSSLAYLRRFPVDAVKIDGAFIRDITTNGEDASLTLAIIDMAHRLNLKVIAECVETAEQLAFLRSHGCDQIQGYYIARPLPVQELEQLWRQTGGVAPGVAASQAFGSADLPPARAPRRGASP